MRFYFKLEDIDVETMEPCGHPRYGTGEATRLQERQFLVIMASAVKIWFVMSNGVWKEMHTDKGGGGHRLLSCDLTEPEKAEIILSAQEMA